MRQRHLSDEAGRFLALTEFARSEAISRGVPMVVWMDLSAGRYGLDPKAGFEAAELQTREYVLDPELVADSRLAQMHYSYFVIRMRAVPSRASTLMVTSAP